MNLKALENADLSITCQSKSVVIDAMKTVPVSTGTDQNKNIKIKLVAQTRNDIRAFLWGLDVSLADVIDNLDNVPFQKLQFDMAFRRELVFIGRMDDVEKEDGKIEAGSSVSISFNCWMGKFVLSRRYDRTTEDYLMTLVFEVEKAVDSRLDGELEYFVRRKNRNNKQITYEININPMAPETDVNKNFAFDCPHCGSKFDDVGHRDNHVALYHSNDKEQK